GQGGVGPLPWKTQELLAASNNNGRASQPFEPPPHRPTATILPDDDSVPIRVRGNPGRCLQQGLVSYTIVAIVLGRAAVRARKQQDHEERRYDHGRPRPGRVGAVLAEHL